MAAAPDSTFGQGQREGAHEPRRDGSSKITQNGQWVGGHNATRATTGRVDQTSDAGSRSAHVQDLLGHDGTGKPQS